MYIVTYKTRISKKCENALFFTKKYATCHFLFSQTFAELNNPCVSNIYERNLWFLLYNTDFLIFGDVMNDFVKWHFCHMKKLQILTFLNPIVYVSFFIFCKIVHNMSKTSIVRHMHVYSTFIIHIIRILLVVLKKKQENKILIGYPVAKSDPILPE